MTMRVPATWVPFDKIKNQTTSAGVNFKMFKTCGTSFRIILSVKDQKRNNTQPLYQIVNVPYSHLILFTGFGCLASLLEDTTNLNKAQCPADV